MLLHHQVTTPTVVSNVLKELIAVKKETKPVLEKTPETKKKVFQPAPPSPVISSPPASSSSDSKEQSTKQTHPPRQRPKPTFSPLAVNTAPIDRNESVERIGSRDSLTAATRRSSEGFSVPLDTVGSAKSSASSVFETPPDSSSLLVVPDYIGAVAESDDEGRVGAGDITELLDTGGMSLENQLSSLLGEPTSPLADMDRVWDQRLKAAASPRAPREHGTGNAPLVPQPGTAAYRAEPKSPRTRRTSWQKIRTAQQQTQQKMGRLSSNSLLIMDRSIDTDDDDDGTAV